MADKDDLKTGAGAEYVDVSNVILCFCTDKYFKSRACAREIFRALLRGKPLIAVLEPDESRGGLTREAIVALLTTARFPPHSQANAPATMTWAEKWGLDGEVRAWGYAAIPTGEGIVAALFALAPIEWNRFTAFQQVTMRKMAERVLDEADRGDAVYVQGEVGNQTLVPPALTHGRTRHLYCSPHNLGAEGVGAELNELFRRRSGKSRGRRSMAGSAPLKVTTSFAELEQCEHMLLYLTSTTWTSAEASLSFAREVAQAQRLGVHLLLVHEFPSAMDEAGSTRGACDFNDMWNEGWTPKHLLTGEANVYQQIAIALKPGAWRIAGLATVALKLGEGGGERLPIELPAEAEEAGLGAHIPAQLQQQQQQPKPPVQSQRRRMSLKNLVSTVVQHSSQRAAHDDKHRPPASDPVGTARQPPPNALTSSKLRCSMRRLSLSTGQLLQRPAGGGMTVRGGLSQGGATTRARGGITRRERGGDTTTRLAGDRTTRLAGDRATRLSALPGATHRERRSHLDDEDDANEDVADTVDALPAASSAKEQLQARRAKRGAKRGEHGTLEAPPSFRKEAAKLPVPRVLPPPPTVQASSPNPDAGIELAAVTASGSPAARQTATEDEPDGVVLPLSSATAARAAAGQARLAAGQAHEASEEVFLPLSSETASRVTMGRMPRAQTGVPLAAADGRGGFDYGAPGVQLSPPVLEDDWGAERSFGDDDDWEDTCGDDDESSAAPPPPRPSTTRARTSGNGVLGPDGKFVPPRLRI